MIIVDCPECGLPAEVIDDFTLPSTDGPVRHRASVCLNHHHITMPVED